MSYKKGMRMVQAGKGGAIRVHRFEFSVRERVLRGDVVQNDLRINREL